jgi:hypothetical protein
MHLAIDRQNEPLRDWYPPVQTIMVLNLLVELED